MKTAIAFLLLGTTAAFGQACANCQSGGITRSMQMVPTSQMQMQMHAPPVSVRVMRQQQQPIVVQQTWPAGKIENIEKKVDEIANRPQAAACDCSKEDNKLEERVTNIENTLKGLNDTLLAISKKEMTLSTDDIDKIAVATSSKIKLSTQVRRSDGSLGPIKEFSLTQDSKPIVFSVKEDTKLTTK